MPNGFHGTKEEWARLEAPLTSLDAQIAEYARQNGMTVRKSDRNWPRRSLDWGAPIRMSLQLSLLDEKSLTFSLAVVAHLDEAGLRSWKSETIATALTVEQLRSQWRPLLDKGRRKAAFWKKADLKTSVKLKGTDAFVQSQRQDRLMNVLLYGTVVTLVFFGALIVIWKIYA